MIESTLKPNQGAPQKKQHWLMWVLIVLVLGAVAVILYFAQSGQFFKGESTMPTSTGPIFYVVAERSTYHCDLGGALLGSENCPFEGIEQAYNHLKNNPAINPAELRLQQGTYFSQNVLNFENRRISIYGGYEEGFSKQNFSTPSVLHSAIKAKNCDGIISNILTFNGGRTSPFIEVDNTGSGAKSFEISNIIASNVQFNSIIKVSTNQSTDQAVIQNVTVTNSRATNGAIIDVSGNGNVLIRNNFISTSYATPKSIIYAEDNVKIANNAIVNTPGGNETGGVYTINAVQIKGGMDAKLVNNTFADNAFSGAVVWQDSEDDYMFIANNLLLGDKYIFNVPDLSFEAARGNYWDVRPPNPGESGTYPNYGVNQNYNGRCLPKLAENRNPLDPSAYKLGADSDCIDQGMQSGVVLNLASPDYFGNTRPAGQGVDPGYAEYIFQFQLLPLAPVVVTIPEGEESLLDRLRLPDIPKERFVFSVCGNGDLETTEECDDGNTTNGDGCSSTCTIETTEECGNGILEAGEECDDGNTANGDGCTSVCLEEQIVGSICGDGVLDPNEDCDDGNTVDGDGCSSTCGDEQTPTEECGNGILEAGEQCDDGNTSNGDGCDDTCFYENPDPDLDLCPNLSGLQLTVPSGYYYDSTDDECKQLIADYCANISGNQQQIPSGYERIGLNCYEIQEGAECGEWTDVSKNDQEYDLWVWLCDRDILKGHADGTLRPEDLLTRSELLALAFRASDYENEYELDEGASYCFVDVDDEWFAPYVCTAEDLGFVEGYAGNIFDPARKVILAEGLKMYLGALDEPFTINVNPDRWYYDMLYDAADDDYLPYTLNDPQIVGPIQLTRRKAANMLYRILIYR